MADDNLQPNKRKLKISPDTRAEYYSLCSTSRFPPSASRLGRLCPGGPSATWRSPDALWPTPENTHKKHTHTHSYQHDYIT